MLNKKKGNMYGFVTHTWNVIKGKCPHNCEYCYMKVFPQGKLRFDEKELKTDLGKGNFIFVGSSCDMFAKQIPEEWINKVLNKIHQYPENTYLLQSKNPEGFMRFLFTKNIVLGTTIETNRTSCFSDAPLPSERAEALSRYNYRKMVTIEPIIDFDLFPLVEMIKKIRPEWVNIGADSKNHNLPEPSKEKIEELIYELKRFTKVNLKDNLQRLIGNKKC